MRSHQWWARKIITHGSLRPITPSLFQFDSLYLMISPILLVKLPDIWVLIFNMIDIFGEPVSDEPLRLLEHIKNKVYKNLKYSRVQFLWVLRPTKQLDDINYLRCYLRNKTDKQMASVRNEVVSHGVSGSYRVLQPSEHEVMGIIFWSIAEVF